MSVIASDAYEAFLSRLAMGCLAHVSKDKLDNGGC